MLGDPSKAETKLAWTPEINVLQMCAEIVVTDLQAAKQLALLKASGLEVNVSVE